MLEVKRTEAGRRGENDQVDVAADHLTVRVEADELVVIVDSDMRVLDLPRLPLDVLQGVFELIGEGITHRNQLDVPGRAQSLSGRSGSPAAATDQADANRIIAVRKGPAANAGEDAGTGGGNRRVLEKIAAGRIRHSHLPWDYRWKDCRSARCRNIVNTTAAESNVT